MINFAARNLTFLRHWRAPSPPSFPLLPRTAYNVKFPLPGLVFMCVVFEVFISHVIYDFALETGRRAKLVFFPPAPVLCPGLIVFPSQV